MEKVSKQALMRMHPGDMKVFSAPDQESVNSARSFICQMQNSSKKKEGVARFEGRRDGENFIVRAVGE